MTKHATSPPRKEPISIRLDAPVVAAFRATGKGWQGRINALLARHATCLKGFRSDRVERGPIANARKRCAHPRSQWPTCPDDWYMVRLRHGGKEYAPNVTRYADVVLGRRITTAAEAEALVLDHLRPAIRRGTYVSAKATTARLKAARS